MGISQPSLCARDWISVLAVWAAAVCLGPGAGWARAESCPPVCRCDKSFVYCNDRGLTSVPSGVPEGATVLYLQNNNINNAGFPADLKGVRSVHTVYLYGNKLEEFPVNLPLNMRELHLQENNIQTISREALSHLQRLEKLHLDDNSISTVGIEEGAFREAAGLKLLFLSRNHLSSVPLGLPLGLQELRLDENRISLVSESVFKDLDFLERLVLDGNLLTNKGLARGALVHLVKLTEFSIIRNSLTSPPLDLPGGRLVKMNLQENQIGRIPPAAFTHLRRLQRLDLSSNQLRALTPGVFDGMSDLRQVLLRNNPWHCDCHMKWATRWLQSLPPSLNVRGLMCHGPEKVRGMAIRDLNVQLLLCPPRSPTAAVAPRPSPLPTAAFPATPRFNASVPPVVEPGSASPTPAEGREIPSARPPPPRPRRPQLTVQFANDTCVRIRWLADLPAGAKCRVTWVKLGHSLRLGGGGGGRVHERVVSAASEQLSLVNLEPTSTYRICLFPLDASNHFHVPRAGAGAEEEEEEEEDWEREICSEARTEASPLNTNVASSPEQAAQRHPSSPLLLAGVIGGAAVVVLVALLGLFCWHTHRKGKYGSSAWKYNRGRRKDDYCEAGTKKDNTILEMTETSFHIASLNNEQMLKEDFRLQSIYPPPNGAISYTDCHAGSTHRYCGGGGVGVGDGGDGTPNVDQCHT